MPDIVGFLYQVHRRQCLCIEGFEILDGSFINVHPQAMCPQFSHGVFCGIAQKNYHLQNNIICLITPG